MPPGAADDPVECHVEDGVAVVTLARPASRNALALELTLGLADTVRRVVAEGARAIVIAANGPVFSAGGSLDELLTPKAPLREMYAGFEAIASAGVPTVAAVGGPALGAGMNVALACDVIVCSPQARFESRFLDIGLHPGGGHLWRLRDRLGRQGAAALAFFGESIDGEAAARAGLAWRCVPADELMAEALRLAKHAAEIDPALVAEARATLDSAASIDNGADALRAEYEAQAWSMARPEFRAGLERMRARIRRPR
jgi:enoyl-CoA hydratase